MRIFNGVKPFVIRPVSRLKGEITLAGDKSIAHRALIISALSNARTVIQNFPLNKDCLSTLNTLKKLGIKITQGKPHKSSATITVNGRGLYGLKKPKGPIFVGDSGTTLRLILGVLSGQDFEVVLNAGKSLSHRPMLRVNNPLRLMGAKIKAKGKRPRHKDWRVRQEFWRKKAKAEEYPPIIIKGGNLKPIIYRMPVASAQVKSAILLAGLYVPGITRVIEPVKTRDHTERMLKLFKAGIKVNQNTRVIKGNRELVSPGALTIPGDISSAAFFIVLAAIIPDSKLLIRNVSLNPSRTGIIRVLKRMGADIKVKSQKAPPQRLAGPPRILAEKVKIGEPVGDLAIKSSALKGTTVKKEEIPSLIDELPILMAAACFAKGKTVFEGVGELRVKETDRIKSMRDNLIKMGAKIAVLKAGGSENIIIEGVKQLKGAKVRSFGDHRTAMSMVVAGLAAIGRTSIDNIACINKSFPDFLKILASLKR